MSAPPAAVAPPVVSPPRAASAPLLEVEGLTKHFPIRA